MKMYALNSMIGGWFAGDFSPTVLQTREFEVAIKEYTAGAREPHHHHKEAEEITVIVRGEVKMCGHTIGAGTIVHLHRGESTDFEALSDTITVVLKRPSVRGDKYLD